MKVPSIGGWIMAVLVTAVGVAVIFRVPMLEKLVIGGNVTKT